MKAQLSSYKTLEEHKREFLDQNSVQAMNTPERRQEAKKRAIEAVQILGS
jgi:hypothetical protein